MMLKILHSYLYSLLKTSTNPELSSKLKEPYCLARGYGWSFKITCDQHGVGRPSNWVFFLSYHFREDSETIYVTVMNVGTNWSETFDITNEIPDLAYATSKNVEVWTPNLNECRRSTYVSIETKYSPIISTQVMFSPKYRSKIRLSVECPKNIQLGTKSRSFALKSHPINFHFFQKLYLVFMQLREKTY